MNGIQLYSSGNLASILLSGYSQMNNLRLAQALSGKGGLAVPPVSGGTLPGKLPTEELGFLKDYQKNMLELKQLAEKALSGGSANRLAAGAEDPSAVEVTGTMGSLSDQYQLSVEQTASGQINRSLSLVSGAPMPSMGGSIKIETEQGRRELYMSAAGAKDNREMLENFASRINAQKLGVTASVEEKEGKVSLKLEGDAGGKHAFSVSGSLAERLGLDQVERAGQDAVYSVSKNGGEWQRFVSDSNTIQLDGRLTVRLKKEGTTTIRAGAGGAAGLADTVSQLVDQFNDTLSFLAKNSDRGVGILNQMKRMILPPTSERSMAQVGITIGRDGSLRFDREMFSQAMERSPSLTGEIVENFARGIRADAQLGLRERSGALLDPLQLSQRAGESLGNPLNFMGMYSRNGVYNMMNYYSVGALMNLNI